MINNRLAFKIYKSLPVFLFVCSYFGFVAVTFIICLFQYCFFWCHFISKWVCALWCDWFGLASQFCLLKIFHFQTNSFGLETKIQVQTNKVEVFVFFLYSKAKELFHFFPHFLKEMYSFELTQEQTEKFISVHFLKCCGNYKIKHSNRAGTYNFWSFKAFLWWCFVVYVAGFMNGYMMAMSVLKPF